MSFSPVLPLDGYAGWLLFKRTAATQEKAFQSSAVVKRETEAFRAKIGQVVTAEDLVSDRALLKVALGAFGLDADLNAKAFVKKVLSDGTTGQTALANRLADKTYYNFTTAFGLDGRQVPHTLDEGFADTIITQYYARQFESAVGEVNDSYRMAMNAERELRALANSEASNDTKWFSIMGSKPLRAVFEAAFSLPESFGKIDVDHQLKVFKDRARTVLGSADIAQFQDSGKLDKLVQHYVIRASLTNGSVQSSAQSALQLLSASGRR